MTHVFERQAGDTSDRGHHLEVSFIEKAFWVAAIEVNCTNHLARRDKRHTNNRMDPQVL